MHKSHGFDTRSGVLGAMVGAGALALLVMALGAGSHSHDHGPIVTWSSDGTRAYLWEVDGETLRCVGTVTPPGPQSAEAPGTEGAAGIGRTLGLVEP